MTEPSTRDKLRAALALERASELVGYCCAAHHGHPEDAPNTTLDTCSPAERVDVGRALGTVLRHQVGPLEAARRLAGVDATDLYAVAELIAEAADWDGWVAVRALRLARQYHRDIDDIRRLSETPEPKGDR